MSLELAEKSWTVALRAQPNQELEIYVYDVIGADFFGDGVTAKDFVASLQSAPDAKRITLRLNSVGGVLNEAKTMGNLLAERAARGTEIVGKVDGLAASAASYLLTFASRVEMPSNGFQMIHQGRAGILGTADQMEARAALLRRENDQIASAYADASARRGKGKSKQDFLAAFAKGDLYLDASEAIDWGLADTQVEPLKTAACLADITSLVDVPEAISAAAYVTRASAAPNNTKNPAGPDARQSNQLPIIGKEESMKTISLAVFAAVLGMTAEQIEAAEEKDVLAFASKLKEQPKPQPATVVLSGVALLGVTTEAEATAKINDLQRLSMALLGTTGAATNAEAMARVMGWKSGSEQVTELVTENANLKAEAQSSKKEASIQKLSREGKLLPAQHDWARANFQTAESLETFALTLPEFAKLGPKEPENKDDAMQLTAEEKKLCKTLVIDEQLYLEQKKLEAKQRSARVGG